jgi:hypothetical protein
MQIFLVDFHLHAANETSGKKVSTAPTDLHFYFGIFPKCFYYTVSIGYKVSNTLWACQKVTITHYVLLEQVNFPACLVIYLGNPVHNPRSTVLVFI